MPYQNQKMGSRIRTASLMVLGAAGLLFVASSLVPASGAWFSDTKPVQVTTTGAKLGLVVTDSTGAVQNNGLSLTFADLLPGQSKTQGFTIRNSGTAAGTALLRMSNVKLTGITSASLGHLKYWVEGIGTMVVTEGQDTTLDLGTLQSGDTRVINIRATLDETSGNEWQGASVAHTVNVVLNQAH